MSTKYKIVIIMIHILYFFIIKYSLILFFSLFVIVYELKRTFCFAAKNCNFRFFLRCHSEHPLPPERTIILRNLLHLSSIY